LASSADDPAPGRTLARRPPRHAFSPWQNFLHGRTSARSAFTATEKYARRLSRWLQRGILTFNDIADLEARFDDTVCAVVLETIRAKVASIRSPNLSGARSHSRYPAWRAAFADESVCSTHRTLFRLSTIFFEADVAVIAKPLAAGLPLGAISDKQLCRSASRARPARHHFGGGPMICAVRSEFLKIVEDEKPSRNIRARGRNSRRLEKLRSLDFDFVREIRGEGCMFGVELSIGGRPVCRRKRSSAGCLFNCTQRFLRFVCFRHFLSPRRRWRISAAFRNSFSKTRECSRQRNLPQPKVPLSAA